MLLTHHSQFSRPCTSPSPTSSTGMACSLFCLPQALMLCFSSPASLWHALLASPSAISRAPNSPLMATQPTSSTHSSTTSTTLAETSLPGLTLTRRRATSSSPSGDSALPYASFSPSPPSLRDACGSAQRALLVPLPRILRVEGAAVRGRSTMLWASVKDRL